MSYEGYEQSTEGRDGRSSWVWVRLADGTLVLGVMPQGDTYERMSDRCL